MGSGKKNGCSLHRMETSVKDKNGCEKFFKVISNTKAYNYSYLNFNYILYLHAKNNFLSQQLYFS